MFIVKNFSLTTENQDGFFYALYFILIISLGKSVQAGKDAMRLTVCEAPTRETRTDHYTGNSVPYSLRQEHGLFNVRC